MIAVDTQTRTQYPAHYRTVRVHNLDIFYREAGRQDAPVILLLHGFPTSSNMFRNLIPRLSGSFRVVAPDYPGLRPEQYAGSHHFRVQLRKPGERDEQFCRVAWFKGILDVRDGLRRADWLPARADCIPNGSRG